MGTSPGQWWSHPNWNLFKPLNLKNHFISVVCVTQGRHWLWPVCGGHRTTLWDLFFPSTFHEFWGSNTDCRACIVSGGSTFTCRGPNIKTFFELKKKKQLNCEFLECDLYRKKWQHHVAMSQGWTCLPEHKHQGPRVLGVTLGVYYRLVNYLKINLRHRLCGRDPKMERSVELLP